MATVPDYVLKLAGGLPDVLPLTFSRGQDRTITVQLPTTGYDWTGAVVQWVVKASDANADVDELVTLDNAGVGGAAFLDPASAGLLALTFSRTLFSNHTTFIAAPIPKLIQAAKAWLANGTEINLWEGPISFHDFGIQSSTAPSGVVVPAVPVQPTVSLGIYTLDTSATGYRDSWASGQHTLVGVTPKIIHRFIPLQITAPTGATYGDFVSGNGLLKDWADDAIASGSVPMLTWEWRDLSLAATSPQSAYTNAQVIAGSLDAVAIAWLQKVNTWLTASASNRLLLRILHEGNGQWYPWAAGTNGNTPISYIGAWRHIAALVATYAPRVELVWTPGTSGSGWIAFEDTYPGNAYVQWLGADFYNTGTQAGGWSGGWVLPATLKPYYDRLCTLSPTKGMIIAETGCVDQSGQNKAAWLAAIPAALATMPRIKGWVEFDRVFSGTLNFSVSLSPDAAVYPAWKALAALAVMQGTLPSPT